jgi:hypothetical protein
VTRELFAKKWTSFFMNFGKPYWDKVNKDQKKAALPMSLKKRLFASFSVSLTLFIRVTKRPHNP